MPKFVWLILINSVFFGLFNLLSQNLTLSCVRDPFSVPQENENVEKSYQDAPINLLGIVKLGKVFGAILEKEGAQETVFLNDKIWGCIVQNISTDFVVVSKEGRQIKLFFR
jgi:hypothetical protein